MNLNSDAGIVTDYVSLTSVLGRSIDSLKGSVAPGQDDRFNYAEGLATKFFNHTLSILYLYHGTNMPNFPLLPIKFLDPASINVLVRAAFETYLTFHFVFAAPSSPDDQDYRYWAYKAAGLTGRQQIKTSNKAHKQKLADEKEIIIDLHNRLRSNVIFQKLSEKRKLLALKGDWRQHPQQQKQASWRQIAISAGLSASLASRMYSHLSGYAHSGSLSVLQTSQALNNREQTQITGASMITANITTAFLIYDFSKIFSLAKAALDAYPNEKNIVDQWRRVGQTIDLESR